MTTPPPNSLMLKTTDQVLLSVKTLTVTSNLCDVYKILYYAAVYVRGHFCQHVPIYNLYIRIVVHGYVVHSVLASYITSIVHVVCTCKQEGGHNRVIL